MPADNEPTDRTARERFQAFLRSQRAPDTLSKRVWLIRLASLTLLLSGNALLQAAALQPAVVDGTAQSTRLSETLDGVVAYALLAVVLMIVSWRSRHNYWRLVLAAVLIIAGIIGALYAWGLVSPAGPGSGVGLRGYLGTYAFVCCALAGVVFLFAYSGRGLFTRPRVIVSGLLAAVGLVGIVAVAEVWLPPIVVDRNISASPTDEELPATEPARLDGSLTWGSSVLPEHIGTDWYPTPGGLLGTTSDGLRMLDPTTGDVRWTYERYDAVSIGTPQVSDDGERFAVASMRLTTSAIVHRAQEALHVWVFDIRTGELLSEQLAPSINSSLNSYSGGKLIWSEAPSPPPEPDVEPDPEARELGWLGATDPGSGELVWESDLPQFCRAEFSRELPNDDSALLVVTSCRSSNETQASARPPRLLRVAADDGTIEWAWTAAKLGDIRLGAADADLDDVLPIQVADSDLPTVDLIGIDLANGTPRWQHPDFDLGMTPVEDATAVLGFDNPAYDHALRGAGDHVVTASVDGAEKALSLAGMDPDTGDITWRRTVPLDWPSDLARRLAALDDGRIVVVSRLHMDRTPAGQIPDFGPPPDSQIVLTTVDAGDGDLLEQGGTTLEWSDAQLLVSPAGAILNYPRPESSIVVGLS